MAEEQAIARVHRIGQQRHVTATKYITPDSIEEVSRIHLRLLVKSVASKHGLTASSSMFKTFKLRKHSLFRIRGVSITTLVGMVWTMRLQAYVAIYGGK
jgi:hypothetical protein